MADKNLNVRIGVSDAYTQGLNKAERAFSAASGAITSVIKVGAIAGAAALGALSVAAYKAVQAANEVDATERKLAAALGYTSQALLDQASALQKVTTFGDDQIVQAQASIAMFIKDENQIKQATKATLDFAAAKGIDLATAGDLIAKTLGSSTNALGRYGIEVKGAVGSTERLDSVTRGLAEVFGGQAAAEAETFGGKLKQIKNSYGDIWEELGFVITRNQFFVKGLDVVTGAFAGLADKIKENRLWLMELTKSGVISFVKGMGYATEAVRFFHNMWLGLKLAAYSVAFVFGEVTNAIYKALRFILLPIDLMYQGMMKLGLVDVNPFDEAQKVVNGYRETVLATGADTLTEIDKTNRAYDVVRGTLKGIETDLKNIQVAQANVAAGVPVPQRVVAGDAAGGSGGGKGGGQADSHVGAFTAAQAMPNFLQDRLNQYQGYYSVLVEMGEKFTDEEIKQALKRGDVQAYVAEQSFSLLSNTMQNLTVLSGKEGGTAFRAMKAFAIAETSIQTFRAAMGAYAALAPIPVVGPALGIAAAAAATVAGMAKVKQIQNMVPGGSATGATIDSSGTANPSYSGGSPSAYPVPTRAEEKAPVSISLVVNTLDGKDVNWARIVEDNLVPALEQYSGRGNTPINLRIAQV